MRSIWVQGLNAVEMDSHRQRWGFTGPPDNKRKVKSGTSLPSGVPPAERVCYWPQSGLIESLE